MNINKYIPNIKTKDQKKKGLNKTDKQSSFHSQYRVPANNPPAVMKSKSDLSLLSILL